MIKKVADMHEGLVMVQHDAEIIEICNMLGYYPHHYPAYMWVMVEDGEYTEAYGSDTACLDGNVKVIV